MAGRHHPTRFQISLRQYAHKSLSTKPWTSFRGDTVNEVPPMPSIDNTVARSSKSESHETVSDAQGLPWLTKRTEKVPSPEIPATLASLNGTRVAEQ